MSQEKTVVRTHALCAGFLHRLRSEDDSGSSRSNRARAMAGRRSRDHACRGGAGARGRARQWNCGRLAWFLVRGLVAQPKPSRWLRNEILDHRQVVPVHTVENVVAME